MAYRKEPLPHAKLRPLPEPVPGPVESWPIPSAAAYVWLDASGAVRLGLPALDGTHKAHSVVLSRDPAIAMKMLTQILFERGRAPAQAKIVSPSRPIQAMLEVMEKDEKARAKLAELDEAGRLRGLDPDALLEELGL